MDDISVVALSVRQVVESKRKLSRKSSGITSESVEGYVQRHRAACPLGVNDMLPKGERDVPLGGIRRSPWGNMGKAGSKT